MNDIKSLLLVLSLLNWLKLNNQNAYNLIYFSLNFITIDPPLSNFLSKSKKDRNNCILLANLKWKDFVIVCYMIQQLFLYEQKVKTIQYEEELMRQRANDLFNWSKQFK